MSGGLRIADAIMKPTSVTPDGEYIERDGEPWFKITNYDQMTPFFMSIVSDTNFWLFVSSNGGLSCGRVSAEYPIFPYYTVDKIHDEHPNTGPKTAMHVEKGGKTYLWEPFVVHPALYKTTRNLYKNQIGNMLVFEEVNEDLGLTFSYTWCSANSYGVVRKCSLVNNHSQEVKVTLLDGLQNIMAANYVGFLQDCMSNLLDAYKWNELAEQQVGVYCLYAKLSDRAEALESLKATTVWHSGLPTPKVCVSSNQLESFLSGGAVKEEPLVRGQRASFLVHSEFVMAGQATQNWMMVAEVEQTHGGISALQQTLASEGSGITALVDADIAKGTANMKRIMGAADGFQCLQDEATSTHHYANVMFNCMRGGIYDNNYEVSKKDLLAFVAKRNKNVAEQYAKWLNDFPEVIHYLELIEKAEATGDKNLARVCTEYVPVTWSRRHGDPSRPWNKFNIILKDQDGEKILNFQGNWRDIFQNWEALTISFPYYFTSIIAKFLNASTIDGYNPYVVNKAEGFAWECPEPDHPHANIGYWGDHQIIYLLKLLEWCQCFNPGRLEEDLEKDRFSYANVPYEIRPYDKIVEDAKDTITFNWEKHHHIAQLQQTMGADAKLVLDANNAVYHVNLAEKLLVPLLAKSSNFVIEGGIWLNTQRPEWNDANNAIVGFGLSMVTVYYMRRYTTFMIDLLKPVTKAMEMSEEVAEWLAGLAKVYADHVNLIGGAAINEHDRRKILDLLGNVASQYRLKVYEKGFSGKKTSVDTPKIVAFLECLLKFIDHSIEQNRLPEGIYHAYNLLTLGSDTAEISYLYPMLEGQVSVLSSGRVKGEEAAALFKSMYASSMYRKDQHTFMLYPDRKLKGFMERNKIPAEKIDSPAVKYCLEQKLTKILYKDPKGDLRFDSNISNAKELKAAIESTQSPGLKNHTTELLNLYELVFNHRAFTGRSGTMFGFEGLGCIYWHMVSKVLLAAQELTYDAVDNCPEQVEALRKYYYDVRAGIGFNKSPQVYGAFPCDPYSHTPSYAGAQQPGMTGQVKEEVLTRYSELGLRIQGGSIAIVPRLLRRAEFLEKDKKFEHTTLQGDIVTTPLKVGQLGFTYCQVPFVYSLGSEISITVAATTGTTVLKGDVIPSSWAKKIFGRTGEVTRIDVQIPEKVLI